MKKEEDIAKLAIIDCALFYPETSLLPVKGCKNVLARCLGPLRGTVFYRASAAVTQDFDLHGLI